MKNLDKFKIFEELLDKAKSIVVKQQVISFLDIIDREHDENVISDILVFLFDDSKQHGFKDLWLKSLLECYSNKVGKEIIFDEIEVDDIKREKTTSGRKRIDIFIDTSKYIVLIENKIYANVNNPFKYYHEDALKEIKESKKQLVEILLTIRKEKNEFDEKEGYNFINITYEELIEHVKKNIGSYVFDANDKWFIYIKDFIYNMEKLIGGTNMGINKDWNKLLKDNREGVVDLIDKINNDYISKMGLLNNISSSINSQARKDGESIEIGSYNIRSNFNYGGSNYSSCVINIKVEDFTLVIEPFIIKKPDDNFKDLHILYIPLWCRNEWNQTKEKKVYDYTEILSHISEKMGITKPQEYEGLGWGHYYILREVDLSEDFDIQEVSQWIYLLYNVIKQYNGRKINYI